MALPTLVKTYQTQRNSTVAAQGLAGNTKLAVIQDIKKLMCGQSGSAVSGLWTVTSSSSGHVTNPGAVNAGTAGAGDNWGTTVLGPLGADAAPLLSTWSAARFPWIVLRQTGIAAAYEVCFSIPTQNDSAGSVIVSAAAGFTGGTTAARPTATDEQILINASGISSGVDVQHQNDVWLSTDGAVTRICTWRGGTNQCLNLNFEVPQNPPAGWASPSVAWGIGGAAGIPLTYAVMNNGANSFSRNIGAAVNFAVNLTCQSIGGAILPNLANVGTVVNSFDSNWPFFGIGLISTVVNCRGWLGSLFDLYYRPASVSDADTFPADTNDRKWVAFGPLILPWQPGGATVPLLT